jgi:hypothetical protein
VPLHPGQVLRRPQTATTVARSERVIGVLAKGLLGDPDVETVISTNGEVGVAVDPHPGTPPDARPQSVLTLPGPRLGPGGGVQRSGDGEDGADRGEPPDEEERSVVARQRHEHDQR